MHKVWLWLTVVPRGHTNDGGGGAEGGSMGPMGTVELDTLVDMFNCGWC